MHKYTKYTNYIKSVSNPFLLGPQKIKYASTHHDILICTRLLMVFRLFPQSQIALF